MSSSQHCSVSATLCGVQDAGNKLLEFSWLAFNGDGTRLLTLGGGPDNQMDVWWVWSFKAGCRYQPKLFGGGGAGRACAGPVRFRAGHVAGRACGGPGMCGVGSCLCRAGSGRRMAWAACVVVGVVWSIGVWHGWCGVVGRGVAGFCPCVYRVLCKSASTATAR